MSNDPFYTLGLETATSICGIALSNRDNLVAEYRLNHKNIHQRKIIGLLNALLHDSGLRLEQIHGMAVSIGPGSFTGLRIGLAVIKGLLLVHSVPLAAVPTLESLAHQAPIDQGVICPLIRAKTDRVYAALYERKNEQERLIKETQVLPINALADFKPAVAHVIGDFCAFDKKCVNSNALLSAYSIARLGYRRIQNQETVDGKTIEPAYFQNFKPGIPKKLKKRA